LSEPDVEEFIAHFGVKGMRWGVRKSQLSSTEVRNSEIARISKRIPKYNTEKGLRVAAGYQLRERGLAKQSAKSLKRNPSFTYKELSPEQKAAFQRKASNAVTRSVMLKGAAQVAALLAGGPIVGANVGRSVEGATAGAIVSVLLAGKLGKTRVSELRSIHAATKSDERKLKIEKLRSQSAG
jgi:hypothetical protein